MSRSAAGKTAATAARFASRVLASRPYRAGERELLWSELPISARRRCRVGLNSIAGAHAMTADTPEYLNCSPDIIGGLIETASVALLDNFPNTHVDLFDIEQVIDALRVLRPRVVEIDTLDGILRMVKGQWHEASQILLRVIELRPKFGYAKALLAFTLSSMDDPAWRQVASEALADDPDNKETRALVRALEVKDEVNRAVRDHRPGQPFVVPASLQESGAAADAGEPESDARRDHASAAEMFQGGSTFLRA
ncbi:HrpB1 family type III secretion system apparatus protein [Burkholderia stabilis]